MSNATRYAVLPKLTAGQIYTKEEILKIFLLETKNSITSFQHFMVECLALGLIEEQTDGKLLFIKVEP